MLKCAIEEGIGYTLPQSWSLSLRVSWAFLLHPSTSQQHPRPPAEPTRDEAELRTSNRSSYAQTPYWTSFFTLIL